MRLSADKPQREVWSSRLQKWLHERFGVYIEDFRFQPEESTVEAEEPLSAKRWVRTLDPPAPIPPPPALDSERPRSLGEGVRRRRRVSPPFI